MPSLQKYIPTTIYTIYSECLRRGRFPKKWEKVKIVPITKPGKDNSTEVTKYRPISLINVAGKVMEKLLTNRIMHHVYRNELLNGNQYGFTPQKSAIDAAVVIKEYLEEALREGKIAIIVTFDVEGAFDSAWWPNIIVTLQDFKCPKNLYNLAINYLSERTAIISTNNIQI